jgi:LAGLIDADG endonuclease
MKSLATDWVVGFVDGEGCFHIDLNIAEDASWGIQVQFDFTVTQHKDDLELLKAIGKAIAKHPENFKVEPQASKTVANLKIKNKPVIWDYVLPYFEKHQLRSRKHLDFLHWRTAFRKYWEVTEIHPKSQQANLERKKVLLYSALQRNTRSESQKAAEKYKERLSRVENTLTQVQAFADGSTSRAIAEIELKLDLLERKPKPKNQGGCEKLEKSKLRLKENLKILKEQQLKEGN